MSTRAKQSPGATPPRAPMALVVVVGLVTAEALRMSGPLLDRVREDGGLYTAAGTAAVVFALPALVGLLLVAVLGARGATVLAVLGLVGLRVLVQGSPGFLAGVALVALAVATLVLVLRQAAYLPNGTVGAVTGLVLGGAADVALRTLLVTWDPVWRPGVLGWSVALAECAALLVALVVARPYLYRDPYPVGRIGVLGMYLAISLLVIGSPGFVASAAGLSLPYASAALLTGALFAVEALSRSALPGGSGRWPDLSGRFAGGIAAVVLVAGVAVAMSTTGTVVVLGVLAAQVGGALAVARACSPTTPVERPTDWVDPAEREAAAKLDRGAAPEEGDELREITVTRRPTARSVLGFGLASLVVGLGYLVVVLPYQMHYELPLPFPNQALVIGAAVVLAVLGLGERPWIPVPAGRSADQERAARRGGLAPLAVVPAVLFTVPVLMLATYPAPATAPASSVVERQDSFRMVSWNIHYARNAAGVIDPEAIATTIERQRPDVVLLQEVARGWPIGGTLDAAEWLSRRLAMPYVYAPAANGQFGNLILSRLRITSAGTGMLPQSTGTMLRSYATATVELEGGRTVRLYDTHLAHREQDTSARLAQIDVLLAAWDRASPAVIAGDLNAGPGTVELSRFTDAGLVSAQDTTGHSRMKTSPTHRPRHRIDWIFGTPDLAFRDFAMPRVTASDHFPLAVTVNLG